MRAFCFLGLVVLLRVVAAGSPRMPPKTIATIEIKLQVLLSRLKWMQECVCDTVPVGGHSRRSRGLTALGTMALDFV